MHAQVIDNLWQHPSSALARPVPGPGPCFIFKVNGLANNLVLEEMIIIDMCECEINFW